MPLVSASAACEFATAAQNQFDAQVHAGTLTGGNERLRGRLATEKQTHEIVCLL